MVNYYSDRISVNESIQDSRNIIFPHQGNALDALDSYYRLKRVSHPQSGLLVMPTGSGKTFTAVNWLLTRGVANGYKIIWLVHRKELVEQTYCEFVSQVPRLKDTGVKDVGILPVSGDHLHMSGIIDSNVYVCSIQSASNKYGIRFIGQMIGKSNKVMVVIDEAHHAVTKSYNSVLKKITSKCPNRILLGLTATPYRMQDIEQSRLQKMFNVDKNIANGIGTEGFIYRVTMKELTASRFLARVVYKKVDTNINAKSAFKISQADIDRYNEYQELSPALMNRMGKSSARNKVIVDYYLHNKDIFGKTLIFALDQLHAETLCMEFKKKGISCDYAVSNRGDAQEVIRDFKDDKFDVLINVQIMTEGSDVPDIKTVFLTRPTNSDTLLTQMIGRGLRGRNAGGTDIAYIVSFEDIWDRFMEFMDPHTLELFEDADDIVLKEEEYLPEIAPNEEEYVLPEKKESADDIVSLHDLYMKLYDQISFDGTLNEGGSEYPVGWYSIAELNASSDKVIVYKNQLAAYLDMENNIDRVRAMDASLLYNVYFDDVEHKPAFMDILNYSVYVNKYGLPRFYTFENADSLDISNIVSETSKLLNEDEQKKYLKKLFKDNSLLKEIYVSFSNFFRTVMNEMQPKTEANTVAMDTRVEYEIVEGVHDLHQYLEEVLEMFPRLKADKLVDILWSKTVIKNNWLALCEWYPKLPAKPELFVIKINLLFSSPEIDKEVIKYLIFHELLHVNGYIDHDREFRAREWQYPDSARLDNILDSLTLKFNTTSVFADAKTSEEYYFYKEMLKEVSEDKEETDDLRKNELGSKDLSDDERFNPKAKGVVTGFKYCRNCGHKLPDAAKFCDKCGSRLDY